ncbi:MAG: hypothetical protein U0807_13375 [Candidatus Binatia bacterium]
MSRRRVEAEQTLARLGVATDTVTADDIARLAEGPDGVAAVEALGEVAGDALAPALAALESRLANRVLRKVVRRALHRLRERGIAVPVAVPPSAPPPIAPPEIEGWVTAVDGRGDRLVWLARTLPGGGTLLISVQLNEPAGLYDVHVAEVTRRQMRAARQSLERDTGLRLVTADWRPLDALCLEAHERTTEHAKHTDYRKVRVRLTSLPPTPTAELASTRAVAPSEEAATTLVARSAALLEQPEFRGWWPDPTAAEPFLQEIAAVRDSPIVLGELQQQERLRGVLAHAAGALYPPAVVARRLRGTAYVLAETGRTEPATQALATAAALELRPDDAGDVPFIAALIQRALGGLLATQSTREQEERRDALVLTPGEVRARSSSHLPRTSD